MNNTGKKAALGQMTLSLLLSELQTVHGKYLDSVKRVYTDYAQKAQHTSTQACMYKDEKKFYTDTMRVEKEKAIKNITQLQAAHNNDMLLVIDELKARYFEAITEKPNADLITALGMYKDFGISGSALQYEALLAANKGNLLGLMAIKNVMEGTNADYTIEFDSPETFEKDLNTLSKIAYNAYGRVILPNFEENAASKEIFDKMPDGECPFAGAENVLDAQQMRFRASNPVDGADMTLREAAEKAACKNIVEICGRWEQLTNGKGRHLDSPAVNARIIKVKRDFTPPTENKKDVPTETK